MTRLPKPPVALYSALADATRCRILSLLLGGPIPVHKLADAFDISRPAISRHLRVLKQAGLVAEVKKGRENLYALRRDKLAKGSVWIAAMSEPARAAPAPEVKKAPTPKIAVPPAVMEPVPRANQMGFDF